jgi:hypothetical protein
MLAFLKITCFPECEYRLCSLSSVIIILCIYFIFNLISHFSLIIQNMVFSLIKNVQIKDQIFFFNLNRPSKIIIINSNINSYTSNKKLNNKNYCSNAIFVKVKFRMLETFLKL